MKLADIWKRIIGTTGRNDITAELAQVYYLAAEITVKAQQADRKLDRLREDTNDGQ